MALIGTNTLGLDSDTIGYWYLTDTVTGHYASGPICDEAFARNLWSRAEILLHTDKLTVETVADWVRDQCAAASIKHG